MRDPPRDDQDTQLWATRSNDRLVANGTVDDDDGDVVLTPHDILAVALTLFAMELFSFPPPSQ